MKNKKAIEILMRHTNLGYGIVIEGNTEKIEEALSLAIKALELERPQGEWIDFSDEGFVECPACGRATTCDGNKDELHFCWNCGARMGKGGRQ